MLDDEEAPRILLADHISGIPGFDIVFSTDDPFWALEIALDESIDILITDIKMPGLSGLQLSKKISHLDIPIIICSVHDQLAVDSFRVNTVDFLRKPPKFFAVEEALEKARISISKSKTKKPSIDEDIVLIKVQGDPKQVMLRPREIQYLEQQNAITVFSLDSGEEIRSRSRFSSTLEKVKRPFLVRVHRSYAVNYLKIRSMDQAHCYMNSGDKIPIGKEYRTDFFDYLHSKTII